MVLSPSNYNQKTGLAIFCPITSKIKGYPFEIAISTDGPGNLRGAILADQVKSLDWKAREARFIGKLPQSTVDQVQEFLQLLLF